MVKFTCSCVWPEPGLPEKGGPQGTVTTSSAWFLGHSRERAVHGQREATEDRSEASYERDFAQVNLSRELPGEILWFHLAMREAFPSY